MSSPCNKFGSLLSFLNTVETWLILVLSIALLSNLEFIKGLYSLTGISTLSFFYLIIQYNEKKERLSQHPKPFLNLRIEEAETQLDQ